MRRQPPGRGGRRGWWLKQIGDLRAQFAGEFVFRAAGRTNRRVYDDMLGRPHARGNDGGAIAADVIGVAIALEQRPDVRRRLVGRSRRWRLRDFERNTGHIEATLVLFLALFYECSLAYIGIRTEWVNA